MTELPRHRELRPMVKTRHRFVPRHEIIAMASGPAPIDARAFRRDLDNAIDEHV